MFLVIALMATMALQLGCNDNQPGSDAPVSIEAGDGGDRGVAETEEDVAVEEEWFITEKSYDGVAITGWKGDINLPRELIIPATIEGEEVVEIGARAFEGCSSLISVVIPEGVTIIESHVFSYCSSLTSVEIPKSVEKIRDTAFHECPAKLRVYKDSYAEQWARDNNREYEIIDKGNDDEVEDRAVKPPADTEEVVPANEELFITESVDGGVAITGWKRDVDIPRELIIPARLEGKKVVEIGKNAFRFGNSLTSVVIPEGVTKIGNLAFYRHSSLTSVVIPESVTEIATALFQVVPLMLR